MASLPRTFSLFPTISLPKLGRMRGRKWMRLVDRVASLPETHPEYLAYTYLIRRLGEDVRTDSSLCVMPGCVSCALDILERYKGSERELVGEYKRALDEVNHYIAGVEQASRRVAA